MNLRILDNAIALVRHLRPAVSRIRARDKRLATQLVDAANSVVLNLGEGEYSDPGNRRARFFTAAGSAAEVRAGVLAAHAWGYLSEEQLRCSLLELDAILAVLWKLTRG